MFDIQLTFKTVDQVVNFCKLCESSGCEVDVKVKHKYLDGKSLLSMLNIDMTEPVKINIIGDVDAVQKFVEVLIEEYNEGFKYAYDSN